MNKSGTIVIVVVLLGLCGCSDPSPEITVEFTNIPDLKMGQLVQMQDMTIGRIRQPNLELTAGKILVPVALESTDTLPNRTVFLLAQERTGQVGLIAIPMGTPIKITSNDARFRGAIGQTDLLYLVGADEVDDLRQWLRLASTKVLSGIDR